MTNLDSILKTRDITLLTKVHLVKAYGFSSSHVWVWELDHKESWALKNWCFWTVVLEKTLESPLDSKEIKPINPKGNQSWIFIGRTDGVSEVPTLWPSEAKNWCFWAVVLEKTLESPLDCKEIKPINPKGNQSWIFFGRTDAEAPVLWPPDMKSGLSRKDPDARKDWGQEEKGMTEDEMVGWYHGLSGHELAQTLGDGEGQGSLACCSPWGCKESDTTERLNN